MNNKKNSYNIIYFNDESSNKNLIKKDTNTNNIESIQIKLIK